MNYFFLKIGEGNSEAIDWLEGRSPNPFGQPGAVIYFDNLTERDYENGHGARQARDFFEIGLKEELREASRMVVVCHGEVWILKSAGRVKFMEAVVRSTQTICTPKAMPVDVLARKPMKDVPSVLAGIGVNQFYVRGTFRKINHWGNLKAIDRTVGIPCQSEHWDLDKQGPAQLLECLGSVEFETLIAKLFETNGCFVPAYRGGVIRDVDLFVHNENNTDLDLAGLRIAARQAVSVQIKTWTNRKKKSDAVDFLIGFDAKPFDAKWVLDRVLECPPVTAWLKRSLNWLPQELMSKFHLN
jgi:hypothetical protein